MFSLVVNKRDKKIWYKVFSGIFNNLAAAWYALSIGFVLIDLVLLTRSLIIAIVFTLILISLKGNQNDLR